MALVDRLSSLPDHVLCHILSFLPTEISVSTSILSTRWRSIWAHVPTLDFSSCDDLTAGLPNITSRVMSLHKVQTLDALHIISSDCINFEPETLIIFAMSRNVKNLNIALDSEFTLPRRLFTFTTLVRLTLSGDPCYYDKTGSNVHLPCIKWLHLSYIDFEVDEDVTRLLSGCPVLEDFSLVHVSFAKRKSGGFKVSSSTLKRLTVGMESKIYYGAQDLECRVEINAPALKYLKVCCVSISISVSPMTSLVEADIDMSLRYMDDGNDHSIHMMKFLDRLCHVKCLSLTVDYGEEFVDMAVADRILRFDNLNKLIYHSIGGWHLFGKLLKVANNLKVLIVSNLFRLDSTDINHCWEEPEQVPACLSAHLRTIRILGMASVESEQREISFGEC